MKIISFEGFEYSGKSTQIKLLQNYFKKNKIKSSFTREPGGNKQLEKIRKIIVFLINSFFGPIWGGELFRSPPVCRKPPDSHIDDKRPSLGPGKGP